VSDRPSPLPDWHRVSVDGVGVYVRTDGITATTDYAELGGSLRHVLTVRGMNTPPNLRALASIAGAILPGVSWAFAPAQLFGGSAITRVAIETTDIALGEIWLAAAEGDSRDE
jgi:hypothetical protein